MADYQMAQDAEQWEADEQCRLLFQRNPQPMWFYSPDSLRFLAVNDAAVRHYGYTREEFLAMTLCDIRPAEEVPALLASLEKTAGGFDEIGTFVHRWKNGVLRHVNVTRQPTACLGMPAVFVIVEDVTERLRAEREIADLNARLQRAMRETHHRVKNSLQIITALIEMLSWRCDDSVPASELERLSSQVRALSAVHDLLTTEAGERPGADDVSAGDALARLVRAEQTPSVGREVRLAVEDVRLASRKVTALVMLVNELIANALKHGGDVVEVTLRALGESVRLEVQDNGPGFADPTAPHREGSLGMELVRSLAQWDLGGTVRFANRTAAEGGGASVTIEFPRTGLESQPRPAV